jgi:hypothetical protein
MQASEVEIDTNVDCVSFPLLQPLPALEVEPEWPTATQGGEAEEVSATVGLQTNMLELQEPLCMQRMHACPWLSM